MKTWTGFRFSAAWALGITIAGKNRRAPKSNLVIALIRFGER
jgi:hypothetical protein